MGRAVRCLRGGRWGLRPRCCRTESERLRGARRRDPIQPRFVLRWDCLPSRSVRCGHRRATAVFHRCGLRAIARADESSRDLPVRRLGRPPTPIVAARRRGARGGDRLWRLHELGQARRSGLSNHRGPRLGPLADPAQPDRTPADLPEWAERSARSIDALPHQGLTAEAGGFRAAQRLAVQGSHRATAAALAHGPRPRLVTREKAQGLVQGCSVAVRRSLRRRCANDFQRLALQAIGAARQPPPNAAPIRSASPAYLLRQAPSAMCLAQRARAAVPRQPQKPWTGRIGPIGLSSAAARRRQGANRPDTTCLRTKARALCDAAEAFRPRAATNWPGR